MPDMDVDAIMRHLNITYDMIISYILGKDHLTDQEIHVLHHWCTGIEYSTARKKSINMTKACEILCKHQKNVQKILGKTVDYCQEKKMVDQYAPDIRKIKYKPDFASAFNALNQPSRSSSQGIPPDFSRGRNWLINKILVEKIIQPTI